MNQIFIAFITGLTTGGLSCLAVQGGLLASSLENQLEHQLDAQIEQELAARRARTGRYRCGLCREVITTVKVLMMKKTFRLEGMYCSNCPMNVEAIEDDLPGIRQVSASYQKGQMMVEFDETKVSEAQILAAVSKRGYQAFPA